MTNQSDPCILVVEDDPSMRALVRDALGQFGANDIVLAADGEAALEAIAERQLKLVVCDWQMEPMDGPNFLRALRGRPGGAEVPVIMLTANDGAECVELARELTISAWLIKPISVARLLERVRAVLGPRDAPAGRATGNKAVAEVPAPDAMARYQAKLGVDIATIQSVLETLPYRERDRPAAWRAMERTLHNIKGQAGTFDYDLVTELARRGHDLLRIARGHPEQAARGHADIARAVASIATAMRRVAHNRVRGDGGEAGLRLLGKLDGFIGPLRAALNE
jgi:two-component system chemotaxis response regulator CheY